MLLGEDIRTFFSHDVEFGLSQMDIEKLVRQRLLIKEINFPREEKLLNFAGAQKFVQAAHALGKTVDLDEGTWDLTHAGHVQHIREAEKHADLVLLRLASAEYARLYKGIGRPVEIHRKMVVSEFEGVDAVWVDETAIPPDDIEENAKILAAIDPDVITLETTDEKLELKLKAADFAHYQLGSRIKPVVFDLQLLNTTTTIINKILASYK